MFAQQAARAGATSVEEDWAIKALGLVYAANIFMSVLVFGTHFCVSTLLGG